MPVDREASEEVEFERRLLASARADSGPHDLQGAWTKFAGVLSPIVSDPALGRGPRATEDPAAGRGAAFTAGPRLARAAAMKWMLLGAIAGSALTTAVLVRPRPGKVDMPPTVVPLEVPAALKVGESAPASAVEAVPARAPSAAASVVPHPRRSGQGRAHARQALDGSGAVAAEAVPVPSSILAAEVSRIDAARSSNAIGDYDETVQLIERYHRDFPDGALGPDADVVALEAVAAKRDQAETTRRAALFLSRYPGDPHAARVRWLANH